jgi:hypothetical protein
MRGTAVVKLEETCDIHEGPTLFPEHKGLLVTVKVLGQGLSLSRRTQGHFPTCTSSDVTPARDELFGDVPWCRTATQ